MEEEYDAAGKAVKKRKKGRSRREGRKKIPRGKEICPRVRKQQLTQPLKTAKRENAKKKGKRQPTKNISEGKSVPLGGPRATKRGGTNPAIHCTLTSFAIKKGTKNFQRQKNQVPKGENNETTSLHPGDRPFTDGKRWGRGVRGNGPDRHRNAGGE